MLFCLDNDTVIFLFLFGLMTPFSLVWAPVLRNTVCRFVPSNPTESFSNQVDLVPCLNLFLREKHYTRTLVMGDTC